MVFSSNRRLHNIRNMCTKIKVLLSFKKLVDLIMKMLYRYPMARHNDMREHSTVLQKVCFKVKLNNWFAFSLFFTRQNAENWFKATPNSLLTGTFSVRSKPKGEKILYTGLFSFHVIISLPHLQTVLHSLEFSQTQLF